MFARRCLLLSLLAISSCTAPAPPGRGVVMFDQDVPLARGESLDTAQREFAVDADATFAAFVQEDDCEVVVKLETLSPGHPVQGVAVDNALMGQGLEVAALPATGGSRLTLRLEGAQEGDKPCHVRARLVRYDSDSRSEARLAALRAWTAATRAEGTAEELRRSGIANLQTAHEILATAGGEGDPELAAWALLVRAWLCNLNGIEISQAAVDAARAASDFSALGQTRNAALSRMVRYAILIDIATDKTAKSPTAEEAARELEAGLPELTRNPALTLRGRARASNFLGVHAYNQGRFDEASNHYRQALSMFEAAHDRRGAVTMRSNLGVLAAELGDYQAATKYFDAVLADMNIVGSVDSRVLYLVNAARADTNAGYIDRAIERLQLARKMNSENGLTRYEAMVLHSLGRAYWARGDISQAAVFFNEALRLRRERKDDQAWLLASLRFTGIIEREAGRVDRAIGLHREAVDLSWSPEMKLRGLLDLAYDYASIPDYPRAIATCREALALPAPEFIKRNEAMLALGEFLLEQPGAGAAATAEAQSLAAGPLQAAVRRADPAMEISARHLLARSLAARGQREQARAEYLRTIDLIFRYSSTSTNPELQAYTLAREQATFRGYLDLQMGDAAARAAGVLRVTSLGEAEALRTIEWVRASSLSNTRAATLDVKSAAQVDALLAQMAGRRVRIAALMERPVSDAAEVERLQLDIAQLRAEVDRLLARRQPAARNSSGAPSLPPLAAGTAQWSFAFGNRHAYLWVRDASGARAAVLPLGPAELQRRLAALNANLRNNAPDAAQELSSFATAMLPRDAIPADATTLQVVADGPLASLPFAALPGVGERAVVMISSEFGGASPQPAPARALRFLGVAGGTRAPANDAAVFPPLASTAHEARSVAAIFERAGGASGVKLLLGAEGSSAQLAQSWQQGIDVLHVATHALADLRQPMTSLLLLPATDAQGQPTYLTAGQIQQWRGDADLVYLSACETAVGQARFADGMPGLQRAFLRAGARGVIATLWPVDDVYASQFAADFYRRYAAGEPAAAALTATQRDWAKPPLPGISASEQEHRRMTAWAHAYYVR